MVKDCNRPWYFTWPHVFRRQPISAILHQLVVEGAPRYLALSALLLGRFATFAHRLCAQIWINMWPDCGPHFGHGRCSPASIEHNLSKYLGTPPLLRWTLDSRSDACAFAASFQARQKLHPCQLMLLHSAAGLNQSSSVPAFQHWCGTVDVVDVRIHHLCLESVSLSSWFGTKWPLEMVSFLEQVPSTRIPLSWLVSGKN